MKTAVISDIHGNVEALKSVLERIDSMNISNIVCLGDIVGYGASPNECVALIRSRNIRSVVGNHDKAVTGALSTSNFSLIAKLGVEWTRSVMEKEHIDFMNGLPYSFESNDAHFVHSSPDLPQLFRYLFTQDDAAESFEAFDTKICFIGHTHRPVIFCEDGMTETIVAGKRCIVNVGSVGQPRDGDWRACFLVFDEEQFSIEHIRVEYNVDAAAAKIIAAGLPQKLADRLKLGV
ncbi:MAG: metallophosphoesterase family protein [Bacteroidota bacterium]